MDNDSRQAEHDHEAAIKATTEQTIRASIAAGQTPTAIAVGAGMCEAWSALGADCAERPALLTACAKWAQERITAIRRELRPKPEAKPSPPNDSAAGLGQALEHAGVEVRFNRRNVGLEYHIDGEWRRGERAKAVALERAAEACTNPGRDEPYRVRGGAKMVDQFLMVVADQRGDEDGDPHWIWTDMYQWAKANPSVRVTFSQAVAKAGIANSTEGRGRSGDLVYILGTAALTAAGFTYKNARPDAEQDPDAPDFAAMRWCGPDSDRTSRRGKRRKRKQAGVSLKPSTFESYPDALPEWTM